MSLGSSPSLISFHPGVFENEKLVREHLGAKHLQQRETVKKGVVPHKTLREYEHSASIIGPLRTVMYEPCSWFARSVN